MGLGMLVSAESDLGWIVSRHSLPNFIKYGTTFQLNWGPKHTIREIVGMLWWRRGSHCASIMDVSVQLDGLQLLRVHVGMSSLFVAGVRLTYFFLYVIDSNIFLCIICYINRYINIQRNQALQPNWYLAINHQQQQQSLVDRFFHLGS